MRSEYVKTLLYWIDERESVRRLKEAGAPPPWTRDPILREWRFCNVDRCDDRETRWIFRNIIGAHERSPVLWFNLAIARFVNWSPTLGALGYFDEWDPRKFTGVLDSVAGKVYTGAYMVPAGPPGVRKSSFLADQVFSPLWEARGEAPCGGNCASWDEFLRRAPCMGPFMRNQIVTDMKYSPHLSSADDWDTFVLAGPGTCRGLNRVWGRELEARLPQAEARARLLELRRVVVAARPELARAMRDLNTLSNCMCELDKYLRVLLGEGKPRARYTPRGATL